MSNNYFSHLPPQLFENQNSIQSIDVTQNPLECVPDSFPQGTVANYNIHSCDELKKRQEKITLPLFVFVAICCAAALLPLLVITVAFFIWRWQKQRQRQRQVAMGGYQSIGVTPTQ